MKILVTGANGYIGRGVINSLIKTGNEIVATDISNNKDCKTIVCNIFAVNNPYEFFGHPDVLLHLAWRDGFEHYSDRHINDLPMHYSFIKKLIDAGIGQVSVMGTMHEVGFFEGSINEHTPCHPVTPYGISKNALRDLVEMSCKKNNVIFQWLRGFYIVGNDVSGCNVFSKIAQAEAEGKKEFPFTSGLNQYDFLDYVDFCNYLVKVICQREVNGIINICSGRPEKLGERAERFIYDNSYHIKLKYGSFPDRDYDSKAIWGDNTKIKRIVESEGLKV